VPEEIDDLLVGENGIGWGALAVEEEKQKGEAGE
jgi:hypothetical protein